MPSKVKSDNQWVVRVRLQDSDEVKFWAGPHSGKGVTATSIKNAKRFPSRTAAREAANAVKLDRIYKSKAAVRVAEALTGEAKPVKGKLVVRDLLAIDILASYKEIQAEKGTLKEAPLSSALASKLVERGYTKH